MDEGSEKNAGNSASNVPTTTTPTSTEVKEKKKKKKGLLSRIWNAIFRSHGDDFEKRLKYISKEEAAIIARIKKRSQSWRGKTRHLIILSVLFEVIAVAYAIMTTRSLDLDWKMRALRVLPMFLLPCLSFLTYSVIGSFMTMRERKDQKTLEKLRAERQAKIDELKEKTNYYTTQQLIQRYDTDPAAKAAAATVLASKLGADSGLKVYVGDESKQNSPSGSSSDVEVAQSGGLRNRKHVQTRSTSTGSTTADHPEDEMLRQLDGSDMSHYHQQAVEHYNPTSSSTQDGGWLARIAALLVGEDPTQSYALICGSCHMHNGLARKEDFPYITYYCPHCKTLNRPKHLGDLVTSASTPSSISHLTSSSAEPEAEAEAIQNPSGSILDNVSASISSLVDPLLTKEGDMVVSNAPSS
ncbi:PREDICTED: uncharacterized protein At2g24330 [Ipomoea nil]|uniref:uncharacterized protein At2g24330 n=1 Tax=Ipomoea nil TaxID=35883 RepID=UPI0009008740|nr:PREDICTED: uncharacterized protein At2g24330 [Ipomoea nil]XP_019174350.1 PREDICTED: uncharacterized protein At2g24330 [Ipomoea nil]